MAYTSFIAFQETLKDARSGWRIPNERTGLPQKIIFFATFTFMKVNIKKIAMTIKKRLVPDAVPTLFEAIPIPNPPKRLDKPTKLLFKQSSKKCTIHSIVSSILQFMQLEAEEKAPTINLSRVMDRVEAATGVSRRSSAN